MLAQDVLARGGAVYGAAFTPSWSVAHCRVDNINNLAELRGSKYVFSHIGKSIQLIADDLEAHRSVLFCGTPCQVAAVRKRFGDNPLLLLVEVVCHGAPSPEYWERYLSDLCKSLRKTSNQISRIDFRDKRTGWKNYSFTVEFSDGFTFTQPHDDNLYMRAFLRDFTLRDGCFRCPFKYPQGVADITIGDYWGISQLSPKIDNDLGTTIVIAHTCVGEAAVSSIRTIAEPAIEDVIRYNSAIAKVVSIPRLRCNFVNEYASGTSAIKIFQKYAGRPVGEKLYLSMARLKNRLVRLFTK